MGAHGAAEGTSTTAWLPAALPAFCANGTFSCWSSVAEAAAFYAKESALSCSCAAQACVPCAQAEGCSSAATGCTAPDTICHGVETLAKTRGCVGCDCI